MASLLERMNVTSKANGEPGIGPVRSKSANRASPYNREQGRESRTDRGDVNSAWSHDLFEGNRTLSERLSSGSSGAPKLNLGISAQRALREAVGGDVGLGGLNIKGASGLKDGNVVQISGLVNGTTAADVEAIFKRCGAILSSKIHPAASIDGVTIRIIFKETESAKSAVQKFDGQQADGRTLKVSIVGGAGVSLGGRLGLGLGDGGVSKNVDVLMDSGDTSGSKMRSDSIAASDPRAVVLVAPPGANPRDYTQQQQTRRGRGGGRGRGRRGGARNRGGMDVDS